MRKQVEAWQKSELTDVTAKVVIYEAFVEGKLEAPKHLARKVHDLCFDPRYEELRSRTIWSLSNAFTSAHSRSWSRFHNSNPRQSWESSWSQGSPSRFNEGKRPFRPANPPSQPLNNRDEDDIRIATAFFTLFSMHSENPGLLPENVLASPSFSYGFPASSNAARSRAFSQLSR
jgi:hypothetical protein